MTSELAQHHPSFILLRFAAQGAVDIALRLDRLITLFLIQPVHGLISLVIGSIATADLTGAATTVGK